MTVQKGILTSWELRPSGRIFLVDDGVERPCFRDRWGRWHCEHDHEPDLPLQDCYELVDGWTAQSPVEQPDDEDEDAGQEDPEEDEPEEGGTAA